MPESTGVRRPVSRRDRPAKPPLSREAIVAAALTLIDGDARLTLRRLAEQLDTGAASLYVYFRDTDEIYAAVLDELLGTLDFRRGRRPWRARLSALLSSYIAVLYAYPALARTALFTRPVGPNSLKLWDTLLRLLDDAGVTGEAAAWGADLLLQQATATAAEHGTRSRTTDAAAEDARMAEALAGVSAKSHPHLAAAASHLRSGTPERRLAWAFDVLVDGILATRPGAPASG